MKAAVIIFHKNVQKYPQEWITQCVESIKAQTWQNFEVFEIDYGGDGNEVYTTLPRTIMSCHLPNHAYAHNKLLDDVFYWKDIDCAFNVNIDDYYHPYRFALQIKAIEQGYDVVSSNFFRVDAQGHNIGTFKFDHLDPAKEAAKGHNIIAHPVCCYSRNFWLNCSRLNPSEIPADDFELWKRSYGKFKFTILPEFLLFQRIHDFNVSKK